VSKHESSFNLVFGLKIAMTLNIRMLKLALPFLLRASRPAMKSLRPAQSGDRLPDRNGAYL